MATKYRTINVNDELYQKLGDMADDAADREGLSRVSLAQMIERMIKVFEDNLND